MVDDVHAVHYSTKSGLWNTPQWLVRRVAQVLGTIDLDPCANSKESPNVPAVKNFTIEDNGLIQDWHGRVYMNPPYGRQIGLWVDKLVKEINSGHVISAIALLPARPDTKWFSEVFRNATRICFFTGRLYFNDGKWPAPFPSALAYFDPLGFETHQFERVFIDYGVIVTSWMMPDSDGIVRYTRGQITPHGGNA